MQKDEEIKQIKQEIATIKSASAEQLAFAEDRILGLGQELQSALRRISELESNSNVKESQKKINRPNKSS